MNELLPLENINAVAIFSEGGLDNLLEQIHAEAESHVPDLETDKGRKAIASNAAKVARSKTYLDGLGKDMVSAWKNQAKVVDIERKKMRDDLDDLKTTIRKPLTDWEQAEDDRVAKITETIQETIEAGNDSVENYLSRDLQSIINRRLEISAIDPADGFGEFEERMSEVRLAAMAKMETAIEKRKQHDLEQKELADLRKEKEERERKDLEAQKTHDRIAREEQIANDARKEAEAREQQAIKDKESAQKRADQAEQDARDKLAREKQAEREETERRERNTRHKGKINSAAVNAIVEASGINQDQARKIVTAIAKNKIANITISY